MIVSRPSSCDWEYNRGSSVVSSRGNTSPRLTIIPKYGRSASPSSYLRSSRQPTRNFKSMSIRQSLSAADLFRASRSRHIDAIRCVAIDMNDCEFDNHDHDTRVVTINEMNNSRSERSFAAYPNRIYPRSFPPINNCDDMAALGFGVTSSSDMEFEEAMDGNHLDTTDNVCSATGNYHQYYNNIRSGGGGDSGGDRYYVETSYQFMTDDDNNEDVLKLGLEKFTQLQRSRRRIRRHSL